jgi:hypothetical protein
MPNNPNLVPVLGGSCNMSYWHIPDYILRVRVKYGDDGDDGDYGVVMNFNGHISVVYPL